MNTIQWTMGLAIVAVAASPAAAVEPIQMAFNYNHLGEGEYAAPAEVAAPGCGCQQPGCGCAEPGWGADPCCSQCGSSDCNGDCCFMGDCCLGDPCTIQEHLTPDCNDIEYGGWVSIGYHSEFTRFSDQFEQGLSFNDHPDALNLHQAWIYVGKEAEAGACSSDWGYRFDMLYGLDAQKTQAYGNPGGRWDTTFDDGVYGWAMPQAYVEYAYGDFSVIAGHFYTLIGYEAVPATETFFYSHSFTMFNSEPFTHTGVLGSYDMSEDTTLFAGWTLGWDTGFDQFGNGNNFLGGISTTAVDNVDFAYMLTAGNFGWRGEGYNHSVVFDLTLTERLNYVLQSDLVDVSNVPDGLGGTFDNQDIGIAQYMFYSLNDCWAVGGRMEWWKSNFYSATSDQRSYYEVTGGINYRPQANVVIRPEIRYNWTPSENAYANDWGVDFNQTVFGVDAVFTF